MVRSSTIFKNIWNSNNLMKIIRVPELCLQLFDFRRYSWNPMLSSNEYLSYVRKDVYRYFLKFRESPCGESTLLSHRVPEPWESFNWQVVNAVNKINESALKGDRLNTTVRVWVSMDPGARRNRNGHNLLSRPNTEWKNMQSGYNAEKKNCVLK